MLKRNWVLFIVWIFVNPQRKKRKTSFQRELFIKRRLFLKFYANIKIHQLRKYIKQVPMNIRRLPRVIFDVAPGAPLKWLMGRKVNRGANAFASIIERRLDVILYRSNFVFTLPACPSGDQSS